MKGYDVVVIGSGLIGVSTAYEIAKEGRKVALLDRKGLSCGASTASTGMLLFEGAGDGLSLSLCRDSLLKYQQLHEELNYNIGFQKLGLLIFFEKDGEREKAIPMMNTYRNFGFKSEIVGAEEVCRMEPEFNTECCCGALQLEQWQMDPMAVVYGYFLKAREYGCEWLFDNEVVGFDSAGDKIKDVITSNDKIYADQFVVATGAWTRDLLQTIGIDIPEFYINGAAMIAEPEKIHLRHGLYPFSTPRVAMEKKASRLIEEMGWENIPQLNANEFVTLPDTHGNLMIAQRSHVKPGYMERVPTEYIRDMAAQMLHYFPSFTETHIIRAWSSPVPFVPDGKPFFGFVQPYNNLFISSGFASVLIMTPVIAKMTKNMLNENYAGYDVSEWEPMRFA